ncbi:DoxX-like family protein [Acinetobacter sp. P8-3-8]|uniref:DoxX-like family protein n=1 Tax=Acinetobacter sp. P8-3-8 TaxID=1029823 RepID=UPI0002485358|nr:DoxX-like family protein [Acinetobacter sp. P8-3-8]
MNTPKTVDHALLTIHVTLAVLWIYQGLVPKIIYHTVEEQQFWQYLGIDELSMLFLIKISGYIEIMFGLLFLIFRRSKILHVFNILGLIALTIVVAVIYPLYFTSSFNPFVMNLAMIGLSIVAIQLLQKKA